MNLTLNIIDRCCSSCYKNTIQKSVLFSSSNQSYELQCNFFLNVISDNQTTYTIIIQNGEYVIIRKIQKNVSTSISIPSKCTHIVTVENE